MVSVVMFYSTSNVSRYIQDQSFIYLDIWGFIGKIVSKYQLSEPSSEFCDMHGKKCHNFSKF